MIFHEKLLLAYDSHEIHTLFFFKLRKMLQKLPSAAVVIGTFRVKSKLYFVHTKEYLAGMLKLNAGFK